MTLISFSLLFIACSIFAPAQSVVLPVHRSRRPTNSLTRRDSSLDNLYDLYYSTTVTVAGQDLQVQLDTGSSELWVRPPSVLAGTLVGTNISISYGIGRVNGDIAKGTVALGDITIPNQAFINYTGGAIDNVFQAGLDGMLGLGFSSASRVATGVKAITHDDSGQTLLSNYFIIKPSQPRIMSFAMSRNHDAESPAGTFSIGEVPQENVAVTQAPAIPVVLNSAPTDFQRWAALLDAVEVNGSNVSLSSVVPGIPSGKAVANIDTGTSLAWVPQTVVRAIYGGFPDYSETTTTFNVPCFAAASVALWFGGQRFPIHPLDLTRVVSGTGPSAVCNNTFIFTDNLGSQSRVLDMQLGDTFLRNVITLYDFGTSGPEIANIKMTSTTDESQATSDFLQQRAKQLGVDAPASVTTGSTIVQSTNSTTTGASSQSVPSTINTPSVTSTQTSPGASGTDVSSGGSGSGASSPKGNSSTTLYQTHWVAVLGFAVSYFAFS